MSGMNFSSADRLAYYANQLYAVKILIYEQDGQICYMAAHPELYGCIAQGRTPTEAVRNLDRARPRYLAALLDMGIEIPLPTGVAAAVPPAGPARATGAGFSRPPPGGAVGDLGVLYETGASLPAA
jgi:predicted RNase H-like HicB family nuclease